MKILFLASRFPFPPKSGRENTLMQYLNFFNDQGDEIYLVAFDKEADNQQNLNERLRSSIHGVREIVVAKLPSIARIIYNILLSLATRKRSLQECLFYSDAIQEMINDKIATLRPHVIFCDMVRTAQFLENIDNNEFRKIFDMDDMLSKRYERLLTSDEGFTGNFASKMPSFFRICAAGMFRNITLKYEIRRIKKREVQLAKNFDATILVSPIESEELGNTVNNNVFYVYPAANKKYLSSTHIHKDHRNICFMGLLNYPPNEKGLVHFVEKIFPHVIAEIPDVRLHIIGTNATDRIKTLALRMPDNIVLAGYVDDLLSCLASMRAFVAPVYSGTGIKTKIVDAMSLGLPVITTEIGSEGLLARHDFDFLIASNDTHYVQLVLDVIRNDELCDRLSHNARSYAELHHDPDKLSHLFNSICKGIAL